MVLLVVDKLMIMDGVEAIEGTGAVSSASNGAKKNTSRQP
jgi:hypothetical protein